MTDLLLYFGDNLRILEGFPNEFVSLIYIDPPFNTGKRQTRGVIHYKDRFVDYLDFIKPRLLEGYRILKPNGSFFFHIDWRESHYCKVLLDSIFGRESFMNEIVWAYDYGGRAKKKWPTKHDTIFWYAKDPRNYTFNFEEMDRIPYMAPGLVGKDKASRGKTPTDVWWHTIVHTKGKEKTGYPTQKPRGIIDRILKVHTKPGDLVCDFFAGSGTTGESARELGRRVILIDNNPEAIKVMKDRFKDMCFRQL